MNEKNLNTLISEALAIEAIAAKEDGALGYVARALVQASIPYKQVPGNEFKRSNGAFKLSILTDSDIGLPYGNIPRLLIAWITTEAVKTKSKELILGNTLSAFMKELDLIPTGGRWGSITRLRIQMKRLFSAAISCTYDDGNHWAIKNIQPVSEANLWWEPKQPNQATLWESTLTLGQEFFEEIINKPVPIDMRALKAIKRSPLAIDIYCWLTYRMSYLKNKTEIPWPALQTQFGSTHPLTSQGTRNFRKAFLRELKKVYVVYNNLNVEQDSSNLILYPCKPHVPLKKCG
jgi:hypothetical protein